VNPFELFLARRPELQYLPQKEQGWDLTDVLKKGIPASRPDPSGPFASFLAKRPPKEAPPTSVEQNLREDVLRAKKHLLEVTAQTLEADGLGDKASLRQVRSVQRYLRHPERTGEVFSAQASISSEGDVEKPGSAAGHSRASGSSSRPRSRPGTSGSRGGPSATAASGPQARGMAESQSAPSLTTDASKARDSLEKTGVTGMLPPIEGATGALPSIENASPSAKDRTLRPVEKEPVLSSWWSRTRSWNITFGKRDSKARREMLPMPGGCVVLGNGRIPLYSGTHLLSMGYYYAFQVDSLDEKNHPLDGLKDMSLGFGVSRYPAHYRQCDQALYGYEVTDSIMVGYGGHLIDGGKWWSTKWDSRHLEVNDIVGLLVSPEGDLVVYVNNQQVLRVPTSLSDDGPPKKGTHGPRRYLFPLIDLYGRVSAVSLQPRASPPNVPLEHRNRLTPVQTGKSAKPSR